MATAPADEILTHRLILPRDANHHGTLYAGALLGLALEAAYSTAFQAAGTTANLVLKRVLDVRCHDPVPVGQVVEVRGREVHRARAYIVVGLFGTPLSGRTNPWMDGLMQFAQIGPDGRPEPLEVEPPTDVSELVEPWARLRDRTTRLLAIRS